MAGMLLRGHDFADYPRAQATLEKAVALDPQFAPAYSVLGWMQIVAGEFVSDPAQRAVSHKLGLASLEKAIVLEPNLPNPYATRAWYRCAIAWDWKGGEEDLQRAVALDRTSLMLIRSVGGGGQAACFRASRLQEALALDRQAIASDPLDVNAWYLYGAHLLLSPGGTAQARAALQRAIDINPQAAWPRLVLGFLDLQDGKAQLALAQFRHAGPGLRQTGEAMAEHTLGHRQQSDNALQALIAGYSAGMAVQIAQVYAWRKEMDLAFEWMERAYELHDAGLVRMRFDPMFAPMRADPRFEAVARKVGVPP